MRPCPPRPPHPAVLALGFALGVAPTAAQTRVPSLELGRVPGGSSSRGAGYVSTDGSATLGGWWRAGSDYPSYLMLDLGAPAVVASMNITGGDPGFKTLTIYSSGDGVEWTRVRKENTDLLCGAGGVAEMSGWRYPARFVVIHMEDHCSGVHVGRHSVGRFSTAEWAVYGHYDAGMVQKFARSWPHCANLGDCFSHVDLADAQAACLADDACDGFSFSAASLSGGRGSGCYKTACQVDNSSSFGRGSHGYWAKQRPFSRWEGDVLHRPSTWPWGARWELG